MKDWNAIVLCKSILFLHKYGGILSSFEGMDMCLDLSTNLGKVTWKTGSYLCGTSPLGSSPKEGQRPTQLSTSVIARIVRMNFKFKVVPRLDLLLTIMDRDFNQPSCSLSYLYLGGRSGFMPFSMILVQSECKQLLPEFDFTNSIFHNHLLCTPLVIITLVVVVVVAMLYCTF